MSSEGNRLTSWKQIARYLGRNRRTVMRWEKRWGMPVHRVGGVAKGSSVYAFTNELDQWLAQGDAASVHDEASGSSGLERSGLRLPVTAGVGVVVVTIAAFGVSLATDGPLALVSGIETAGDLMTVTAVDGSVAWRYRHPEGYEFHESQPRHSFIDVDGDGGKELLLATNTVGPDDQRVVRGELLAFGSDERLSWRLVPTDSLAFGDGRFGPPWVSNSLDIANLDGETRLLWRVHHWTWWPGMLLVLSPEGETVGRFVNSGWILSTGTLPGPDGDLLLVGGISNSRGGAMLAVLDPGAVDGTSPEDVGSPYECLGCPPGDPLRYVVFGRSHVNHASGLPYNRTASIEPSEVGFKAVVVEGEPTSGVHWVYELSSDLELVKATPGDSYWPRHELLRLEGLIDHTEEECPERTASPTVSSWTAEGGWRVANVPVRPGRP